MPMVQMLAANCVSVVIQGHEPGRTIGFSLEKEHHWHVCILAMTYTYEVRFAQLRHGDRLAMAWQLLGYGMAMEPRVCSQRNVLSWQFLSTQPKGVSLKSEMLC
jgi:hypothetical protein